MGGFRTTPDIASWPRLPRRPSPRRSVKNSMKGVLPMRRLTASVAVAGAFLWTGAALAQRGGAEWTTTGGDAQRSSWLRTDPKISRETMQKPGFQFLWKIKFNNDPKQLNSLTPASLLGSYI